MVEQVVDLSAEIEPVEQLTVERREVYASCFHGTLRFKVGKLVPFPVDDDCSEVELVVAIVGGLASVLFKVNRPNGEIPLGRHTRPKVRKDGRAFADTTLVL